MVDLDTQIALPMRTNPDGQITTVKTGTATEITQRAMVLCATRPGALDRYPDYGLQDQTGRAGGPDLDLIDSKLTQWIPDIGVLSTVDPAGLDRALALVNVAITAP